MGMGGNRNPMESKGKTRIRSRRTHCTASSSSSTQEVIQWHLARRNMLDVRLAVMEGYPGRQAILAHGFAGKILE
jgi:hypothetical protein